jgi:hypothetical protein
MNMWLNKKRQVSKKPIVKRVAFLALLVGLIIAVGFYTHYLIAGASAQSPEVTLTDLSGNSRSLFAPGESALLGVRVYGKNTPSGTPSRIDVYEQFPSITVNENGEEKTVDIITFDEVYSLTDQNGTSQSKPTPVNQGHNYYKFSLDGISVGNYLELKVKIKMGDTLGSYDALSNYANCEKGPLEKSAENSRVEYIDTNERIVLNALCLNISKDSPYIIKTTYGSDPGDDPANTTAKRKATFEAGENVWVVLEINEPETSRTDFKVSDRIPGSVSGNINYKFIGAEGATKSGTVLPESGIVTFSHSDISELELRRGKNYIIYWYKI